MKIDLKPQVFSNLILTLLLPIRLMKKFPKNSFVSGLIFGAIFSLVVNVITVQLQETIQKQRILEAVENEILNNVMQANSKIKFYNDFLEKDYKPNFYYSVSKYGRDLWEQSSEPLQYLVQLDRDVQIPIQLFYTITIPGNNQMLDRIEDLRKDKLINCFGFDENIRLTPAEEKSCISWNAITINQEFESAKNISNQGFEVLNKFHPTADRLRNPFLRFIIGNKSTRVLSGE